MTLPPENKINFEQAIKMPNPETIILEIKYIEWIIKYHDPVTGKRTPEWVAFEEYTKIDL